MKWIIAIEGSNSSQMYLNSVLSFSSCGHDWVNSSVSLFVVILFLSQCSTPCHNPIPPALNKQAMSIRMAEAVMFEGEVFQHPLTPAVKETNMKKNPTMK